MIRKKKGFIYFLFFLSFGILLAGLLGIRLYEKEQQIETKENRQTASMLKEQEGKKPEVTFMPLEKEIANTYEKYPVIAQLTIPKIKVDTPVLQNFSEQAMKKCVTKLTGGEPNEIGNFCIIGHNYVRKNMFSKLKQLKKGDSIYLSDRVHGTLGYIVESLSIVKPEEVSCLNQQNHSYELTLITCTADSNLRIIVKAKAETNQE